MCVKLCYQSAVTRYVTLLISAVNFPTFRTTLCQTQTTAKVLNYVGLFSHRNACVTLTEAKCQIWTPNVKTVAMAANAFWVPDNFSASGKGKKGGWGGVAQTSNNEGGRQPMGRSRSPWLLVGVPYSVGLTKGLIQAKVAFSSKCISTSASLRSVLLDKREHFVWTLFLEVTQPVFGKPQRWR